MPEVWNALRRWTREVDWYLVALVGAFVLIILQVLPIPLQSWLAGLFNPAPFVSYESALADAAIKNPAAMVQLQTIDLGKPEVLVTTFRFPSLQAGKTPQPLASPTWVTIPRELKAACAGAPNAVRALQQILGLPRMSGDRVVYEMTVQTKDIFRPCMSGPQVNTPTCSFDLPPAPDDPSPPAAASNAGGDDKDKALAALRKAYDDLRFVSNQMWTSYRTGFRSTGATAGDYPYTGYPFTGMGWTYNWDPSSTTHIGVSEFVVRKGAQVTVERAIKPEDFCSAQR
jgi:hypothetical protein